jgi:hypothetical protein
LDIVRVQKKDLDEKNTMMAYLSNILEMPKADILQKYLGYDFSIQFSSKPQPKKLILKSKTKKLRS